MTRAAEKLKARFFSGVPHPYEHFDRAVRMHLPADGVLLDAGCGRSAPMLVGYKGRAKRLIGVDVVKFAPNEESSLELIESDLCAIPLESSSVDLIMARSVMEHVSRPTEVYREMYRLLRPGGRFIFLTANLGDYAAIIARIIPNRLHPWIVAKTEGRAVHDVFPTEYKTNTRGSITRLAAASGFELAEFRYLGQYPDYFMFNAGLFLLATAYEKVVSRFDALGPLRGWILATLRKPDAVR